MKKAIVLLMTIGFITIISALVMVSLSISKRSFEQVAYIEARNQFSVVFKDFVKALRANSKLVTEKKITIDDLLGASMPPMTEPESGVESGFLMESKMGKLNINYMLKAMYDDIDEVNSTYLEDPILRFFSLFKVKEPRLLLDILQDTYDQDDMEKAANSELANIDFDFAQGGIYSYSHLSKIFDSYFKNIRDPNVYNINKEAWEEVFYYGDSNKTKQLLDCSQLEYTDVMPLLDENYIENDMIDICEYFKTSSDNDYLNKLKNIYSISDFNETKHYLIKCDIIFNTENFNKNISFDYDLKNGEISNIDKNIQE